MQEIWQDQGEAEADGSRYTVNPNIAGWTLKSATKLYVAPYNLRNMPIISYTISWRNAMTLEIVMGIE
jgi:hypothetical protein